MAGPLQRLTSKLYDTPHIVTQSRLDDIFGYLEDLIGVKKVQVSKQLVINFLIILHKLNKLGHVDFGDILQRLP